MEFLPHKVDLISLSLGLLVWALVLALIWWPRRPGPGHDGLGSYLQWTRDHGMGHMSYQEYVESGQAGAKPLTRKDLTVVVTLIGALVLFLALERWGAIS